MSISVVTSLYRSAPYLEEFCRRASEAARGLTPDYELILVNDGSPDDALQKAVELQARDPHIVVIDLSRNFGHHVALLTGMSYAKGAWVYLIDCDLEEEPEWLTPFHEALKKQNADVIYGVQDHRKGAWGERCSGWAFYKLFNLLSGTETPPSATTARLMSRAYVDAILRYNEREVFLPGLWPQAGYTQLPFVVHKHSKGTSTYTLTRKLALAVNAITSFSNKPLVFIFYTGLILSLGAGSYILWLVHRRLFNGIPLMGWPSLIVSVWFLGGLTIFFIGVLGIYLAKIFSEIKQRPRTLVRRVFGSTISAPLP